MYGEMYWYDDSGTWLFLSLQAVAKWICASPTDWQMCMAVCMLMDSKVSVTHEEAELSYDVLSHIHIVKLINLVYVTQAWIICKVGQTGIICKADSLDKTWPGWDDMVSTLVLYRYGLHHFIYASVVYLYVLEECWCTYCVIIYVRTLVIFAHWSGYVPRLKKWPKCTKN